MKDMSIIANKKIINKETNEVRLVVSIDEENRKIHSVPADEPNAEPSIMAAASYDRRWTLYEEPETAETEVNHDEPMKMSDVVTKLESLFDILNRVYFDNALPKPVITVQSTPKAYGHCSTKRFGRARTTASMKSTSAPSSSIVRLLTRLRRCAMRWSIFTAS